MSKSVQLSLQELYDNAVNNAKMLQTQQDKLQILLAKEDITNLSIMTPQTISNSAKIFNNLSTINNLLITTNIHSEKLLKVLPLLQNAQKLLIQSFDKK